MTVTRFVCIRFYLKEGSNFYLEEELIDKAVQPSIVIYYIKERQLK